MLSAKEGEDAFMKIGQALDSIDYQQLASNSRLSVVRSHEQGNSTTGHNNESIHCASEALPSDASCAKLPNDSDKVDAEIPSELITSCVATLIMIQVISTPNPGPFTVTESENAFLVTLEILLCFQFAFQL